MRRSARATHLGRSDGLEQVIVAALTKRSGARHGVVDAGEEQHRGLPALGAEVLEHRRPDSPGSSTSTIADVDGAVDQMRDAFGGGVGNEDLCPGVLQLAHERPEADSEAS